jgi:zinc/manganese transport system substrate-binding protein
MLNGFIKTSFTLTLASVLILSGCSSSSKTTSSSSNTDQTQSAIKLVAAENFYGEVAQAVGGDRVEVTSILDDPNLDPHDYEPKPDDSKTVDNAAMVIYNGAGYDSWMEKLINAGSSADSKTVIKVAEDVQGIKEGDNEHVWYDPTTMSKLANSLADQLAKIDPDQSSAYQQRAKDYITSLSPLTDKVNSLKQSNPIPIDVSEPVFGYMAKALNLQVNNSEFAKALDEGTDPSPAVLGNLQNDLKEKKVKLFVNNIQNSSPIVENMVKLAEANGVPIVQVTETKPEGKNYLQWMTDQLDQVGKALALK